MFFKRSQPQSDSHQGFPSDAIVIVIPKSLIERFLTLMLALFLGGTMVKITLQILGAPSAPVPVLPSQKP